jgi:glycosyltransferase involved in cell wall biosynthesis
MSVAEAPGGGPRAVPKTVSFIVTALNEAEDIEASAETVRHATEGLVDDYEVILVDDGSTDGTGAVMDRMAAADRHLRVIHNERNLGLGGAYKRGLAAAGMEYVMWVSGDNAETILHLRNVLGRLGQADIIVPYLATQRGRPLFRRLTSRTFVAVVNLLFGLRVRYYNGSVVHRTRLIRGIEIGTDSFAYQAEALIKLLRAGHSFAEVGYTSASYSGVFSHALKPRNLWGVLSALAKLFVGEHFGRRPRA